MPSSDPAKRAEQQRLRRARARAAALPPPQPTDAEPLQMGAAAAEHTVERQLAAGVWLLERPPQLLSDFGGESNRTSYEIARMQWYEQWTGESLPPYDPCAAASERKQQVDARAPPRTPASASPSLRRARIEARWRLRPRFSARRRRKAARGGASTFSTSFDSQIVEVSVSRFLRAAGASLAFHCLYCSSSRMRSSGPSIGAPATRAAAVVRAPCRRAPRSPWSHRAR